MNPEMAAGMGIAWRSWSYYGRYDGRSTAGMDAEAMSAVGMPGGMMEGGMNLGQMSAAMGTGIDPRYGNEFCCKCSNGRK